MDAVAVKRPRFDKQFVKSHLIPLTLVGLFAGIGTYMTLLSSAASSGFYFAPSASSVVVGNTINVQVKINHGSPVDTVQAYISYPSNLEVVGLPTVVEPYESDFENSTATPGLIKIQRSDFSDSPAAGDWVIATITFKAKSTGTATVGFTGDTFGANVGQQLTIPVNNASYAVSNPAQPTPAPSPPPASPPGATTPKPPAKPGTPSPSPGTSPPANTSVTEQPSAVPGQPRPNESPEERTLNSPENIPAGTAVPADISGSQNSAVRIAGIGAFSVAAILLVGYGVVQFLRLKGSGQNLLDRFSFAGHHSGAAASGLPVHSAAVTSDDVPLEKNTYFQQAQDETTQPSEVISPTTSSDTSTGSSDSLDDSNKHDDNEKL